MSATRSFSPFRRRASALVVTALASLGCADLPVVPEIGPPALISIAPVPVLDVDGLRTVHSSVTDASGRTLAGVTITWSTTTPEVLHIESTNSEDVLIKAVAPGRGRLVATVAGVSAAAEVVVRAPGPVAAIYLPRGDGSLVVGQDAELNAELRDGNGVLLHVPVTVTSSDTTCLVADGIRVVGVGAGRATLTVSVGTVSASRAYVVQPGAHAFVWTASGGLVDLGLPAGYHTATATAVSSTGAVAGTVTNAVTQTTRAFVWTREGGIELLPLLAGALSSAATGINASGTVVGYAVLTYGDLIAVQWDAGHHIALVPSLDGQSAAKAINDAGQIVGWSDVSSGPTAFLWSSVGGTQLLDPYHVGEATSINAAGQVAGTSANRGFVWSAAQGLQVLPALGGDPAARAIGIASDGVIVGTSSETCTVFDSGDNCLIFNLERAVLWPSSSAKPVMFESLAGPTGHGAYVTAINGAHQVTGELVGTNRGFVWTESGGFVDIGVLPGRSMSVALAINDAGAVVGMSTNRDE